MDRSSASDLGRGEEDHPRDPRLEVNDITAKVDPSTGRITVQSWSKVSLQSGTLLTSTTVILLFF